MGASAERMEHWRKAMSQLVITKQGKNEKSAGGKQRQYDQGDGAKQA